MATRQTFHTPSFGDEEFEIFSAPTFDHSQQQSQLQQQQQLSANNTTELSLLSPTSSSSTSSLHNILPVVTTNQSINQWQAHSTVGGDSDISVDTGYSEKSIRVMGDTALIGIDENDAGRFSSTISNEDLLTTGGETKTKKKRDPNEPAKPISSYALFFRDTQTAIKGQNPNASFGEISRIVARMWDALDPEHKNVYKKKTELAKKEYLKSLAAYRNSLANKSDNTESSSSIQESESNQINIPISPTSPNSQNMLQSNAGISRIPSSQDSPLQNTNPTANTSTILNVSNSPSTIPNRLSTSLTSNQSLTEIPSIQQPNNNSLTTAAVATATSALTPNNVATMNQSPSNTLETNQQQTQKCIREGCSNTAIINPDWEDEYCSNECVIIHCRDVFSQWIQSNNLPAPVTENFSAA